jgi:hypothetical protein
MYVEEDGDGPLPHKDTPRGILPDVLGVWRHVETRPVKQADFAPVFDRARHVPPPQPVGAVMAVDRGQHHGGLDRRQLPILPPLQLPQKRWVLRQTLGPGHLELVLKQPLGLSMELIRNILGVPVMGAVFQATMGVLKGTRQPADARTDTQMHHSPIPDIGEH